MTSKWLIVLYGFERGKQPKKAFQVEADNPVSALHQVLSPDFTDLTESGDKADVYRVDGRTYEYELQKHWGETS